MPNTFWELIQQQEFNKTAAPVGHPVFGPAHNKGLGGATAAETKEALKPSPKAKTKPKPKKGLRRLFSMKRLAVGAAVGATILGTNALNNYAKKQRNDFNQRRF